MLRTLAAVLASMAGIGHAWAGCSNYTDGSLVGIAAPTVTICFKGICEDTTVDYECGNAHTATWGYANGWTAGIDFDTGEITVHRPVEVEPTDYPAIFCKPDEDGDACFTHIFGEEVAKATEQDTVPIPFPRPANLGDDELAQRWFTEHARCRLGEEPITHQQISEDQSDAACWRRKLLSDQLTSKGWCFDNGEQVWAPCSAK